MKEIFSYIVIAGIFLAGIVPMIGGIVHMIKENRKLDEVKRGKKRVSRPHSEEHPYALME